jgi:hypothetical protein
VFVRQGHYAHDPVTLAKYPPADVSIERIGELLNCSLDHLSSDAGAKSGKGSS